MRGSTPSSNLAVVEPVQRETLNDRVYRALRKLIVSGGFAPGVAFTLRALAAALGTSEMPVRDAIRRLVTEGGLEMLPSRKVAVPFIGLEQYEEILRVRMLLEGEAAQIAARSITAGELLEIERIQRDLRAAKSPTKQDIAAANQQFHYVIYAAARLPLLTAMIETLWLRSGPTLHHLPIEISTREIIAQHERVLAALRAHDEGAAREAMVADLKRGGERILAELRKRARGGSPPRHERPFERDT
ncbi:MAG: GntR family transcriptional regulator [Stellaceae bacterium]